MISKGYKISIAFNIVLLCSTVFLGVMDWQLSSKNRSLQQENQSLQQQNVGLQGQIQKLSEQVLEIEYDGKVVELARQKEALVESKFGPVISQFVSFDIDAVRFNEQYDEIKRELSGNETSFSELLSKYRELYQKEGRSAEEISEKIGAKFRLYGSQHLKLMLGICQTNLDSVIRSPLPKLKESQKLFTALQIIDPEAVELEVTAPAGCNIRLEPKGQVIGTVAHATKLVAKNYYSSWYQVEVPQWVTQGRKQSVGWIWDKNVKPKNRDLL